MIGPIVEFHRGLAAKNHGDRWLPFELAGSLYAQTLAEPAGRAALLGEAAVPLESLSAELRPLRDVRLWRERVHKAQQGMG